MKRLLVGIATLVLLIGVAPVARASDDPDWQVQWGPVAIHAPEAWTVARGKGVTIAIVDSGIQRDHPDLRDKIVPGYDFADNDNDPTDPDNGHGTHVAGIAAASTDNGIGIAGVAPDAKIMPIRVAFGNLDATHYYLQLEQAVRFAVDNGAKVINMSLGGSDGITPAGLDTVSQACQDAFNSGALCTVAAGNSGRGKPSGYTHTFPGIVVAASGRDGQITDFSQNADTQWAVTAPGKDIYSTWLNSGYQYEQGTSMAAPHVAAVAALLFSQGKTVQQVVDKIVSTATPMNDGGAQSGAGMLNAAAAVGAPYQPASAPAATPTPTSPTTPSAGGRPSVSTPSSGGPTTTVTLAEGNLDNGAGDFSGGSSSDFESALGKDAKAPKPISTSGGITLSFASAVGAFVAVLGALGFVARRVIVRRGIGAAKHL